MKKFRWIAAVVLLRFVAFNFSAYALSDGAAQDDLSLAVESSNKGLSSGSAEDVRANGINIERVMTHIRAACSQKQSCLSLGSADFAGAVKVPNFSLNPTRPVSLGSYNAFPKTLDADNPQSSNSATHKKKSSKAKWVLFGIATAGAAAGDTYAFKAGLHNARLDNQDPRNAPHGSMTTGGAAGITIVDSVVLGMVFAHLKKWL